MSAGRCVQQHRCTQFRNCASLVIGHPFQHFNLQAVAKLKRILPENSQSDVKQIVRCQTDANHTVTRRDHQGQRRRVALLGQPEGAERSGRGREVAGRTEGGLPAGNRIVVSGGPPFAIRGARSRS